MNIIFGEAFSTHEAKLIIILFNVYFFQFCIYASKIKLMSGMLQDAQGTLEALEKWKTREIREIRETRETPETR